MTKMILCCLMSTFLLTAQVIAEVKILVKHRVANQSPGYCVWCSLDTWGNHTKNKQLIGLTAYYVEHDRRAISGRPETINRQLSILGVKYEHRLPGKKDFDFVKQHVQAGRAVMADVRDYPRVGDLHAILIVDATDESVRFIDSNDIEWDWLYKTTTFKQQWTGWAVVILD